MRELGRKTGPAETMELGDGMGSVRMEGLRMGQGPLDSRMGPIEEEEAPGQGQVWESALGHPD